MKKKLDCLTPESINSRFLESTRAFENLWAKQQQDEWLKNERERMRILVEEFNLDKKTAKEILKKRAADIHKKYSGELYEAQERIRVLEGQLNDIRGVLDNPNHCECL